MIQEETSTGRVPAFGRLRTAASIVSLLGLMIVVLIVCAGLFLEGHSEATIIGVLLVLFVLMTGTFVALIRGLKKAGDFATIDYLNLGIQRYVLALFMVQYGMPKVLGRFFDYQLFALDTPMGSVSDFELAWYFYGLNPWQELFAGLMELVPGLMLLHRRTYYLGAVILLPVVGQVLLLNFFMNIGVLTLPFAVVLLGCNLAILVSEKDKIVAFIASLDFSWTHELSARLKIGVALGRWLSIALCAFFILNPVRQLISPHLNAQRSNELVGVYTLESMQKAGKAFDPGTDERYYKDLYFERQSRFHMLRRLNNKTDAFQWRFVDETDGFTLKINAGGAGDRPDVIVEENALEGRYQLQGDRLLLTGTQNGESVEFIYRRRAPKPKSWFW